MKQEIVSFVKEACVKYKLNANYIPDGDIWVIHKQGRAVQNFTTDQFYQIPKRARMSQFEPLVRIGLANNLGAAHKNQVFINRKFGRKIL